MCSTPDTISSPVQEAMIRGMISATMFPFETAMLMYTETIKDVRNAHLHVLEIQRQFLSLMFPWQFR